MAQKIRIKRRAGGGGAGAPTTLASAELAFNEASKILYYGLGDTGSGEATTVIAIGGEGAFLPSTGGGSYVKTVSATANTSISATTSNGDVTWRALMRPQRLKVWSSWLRRLSLMLAPLG